MRQNSPNPTPHPTLQASTQELAVREMLKQDVEARLRHEFSEEKKQMLSKHRKAQQTLRDKMAGTDKGRTGAA